MDQAQVYQAYIQSEAWREVRKRYFKSKLPKRCAVCRARSAKGFHLHHKTYKRLGRERLGDLMLLCPPCHEELHVKFDKMRMRQRRNGKRLGGLWGFSHGLARKAKKARGDAHREKQRRGNGLR